MGPSKKRDLELWLGKSIKTTKTQGRTEDDTTRSLGLPQQRVNPKETEGGWAKRSGVVKCSCPSLVWICTVKAAASRKTGQRQTPLLNLD